ncbi:MAG: TPM domain-containing protein [Ferruginibacter sp.]
MRLNLPVTYRSCFFVLLLLALILPVADAQIPDSLFPKQQTPPRLVNDFAAILSVSENQWLEDKLVAFDKQSSSQVCIVIVKTIADHDIADYATALGRSWGIGQKAKNNGVLIVLVMNTHQVNISPGYGLEAALPDLLCKQIIENEMVPSFKNGYYYDGLDKGSTVIISATKGEFTAGGAYGSQKKGMPRWLIILILIVGINGFFILGIPLLRKLFYYIIGKKPPVRRPSYRTDNTPIAEDRKEEEPDSTDKDNDDFGGYGGGSFGGAGASGKW